MSERDVARPFTVREDMAAAWTAYTFSSCAPVGTPAYSNGLLGRLAEVADQHIAQARREDAARIEALESALERTEDRFRTAVAGRPVRDMAETLAENHAALRGDA